MSNSRSIPQTVLDHYNRCYLNSSYTAFKDSLKQRIAGEPAYGDNYYDTALNLLIDASLERSGATFYQGAEQSLMTLLAPLDDEVRQLAYAHLATSVPNLMCQRAVKLSASRHK